MNSPPNYCRLVIITFIVLYCVLFLSSLQNTFQNSSNCCMQNEIRLRLLRLYYKIYRDFADIGQQLRGPPVSQICRWRRVVADDDEVCSGWMEQATHFLSRAAAAAIFPAFELSIGRRERHFTDNENVPVENWRAALSCQIITLYPSTLNITSSAPSLRFS